MTRLLAPVRIRSCDRADCRGCGGWVTTCRVCADRLTSYDHREALAWAHGHMHVRHPGWHDRTCKHQLRSHPFGGLTWCLNCGQDTA